MEPADETLKEEAFTLEAGLLAAPATGFVVNYRRPKRELASSDITCTN